MSEMDNTEEIELKELLSIIWKSKVIIAMVSIGFALVGGIVGLVSSPTSNYETFTTLKLDVDKDRMVVGDLDAQMHSLQITERFISNYVEIAKSKKVADTVIEKLNLKEMEEPIIKNPYEYISENMVIEQMPGTDIVKITMEGSYPQLIADIVRETANAFIEVAESDLDSDQIKGIRVIDEAFVPKEETAKNMLLPIVIAGVLGVMVSIFAVFFKNYLYDTIKSRKDVESRVGISVIGEVGGEKITLSEGEKLDKALTEQYRDIRTGIVKHLEKSGANDMFLAGVSTGKSNARVVSNLALTMAKLGKKTILIDCDFKTEEIEKLLSVEAEISLNDALIGEKSYEDVVQATNVENLSVLASKQAGVELSELLDSDNMRDILARARQDYDIVMVYGPPIVESADSKMLASNLEMVLAIAELDKTKVDSLEMAKRTLDNIDVKIDEVVLSKV